MIEQGFAALPALSSLRILQKGMQPLTEAANSVSTTSQEMFASTLNKMAASSNRRLLKSFNDSDGKVEKHLAELMNAVEALAG